MSHVRVATYEIKKESFPELAEIVREEMLRVFRKQPGFVTYGLADLGDKRCLSLSLWETRKDADAANAVSAEWVRELMSDRVELRTNEVGASPSTKGPPRRSDFARHATNPRWAARAWCDRIASMMRRR